MGGGDAELPDLLERSSSLFAPGPATPDFYALVAQRLEQLVQEQLRSPPSPGEGRGALQKDGGGRAAGFLPPQPNSLLPPAEVQGPPATEKEALLRRLVVLLEQEAEAINQKVTAWASPWLGQGLLPDWALGSEAGSAVSLGGRLGEGGTRLL